MKKTMERQHFSVSHRLLHWMIALGILIALFTAFLHATWMNGHGMATTITSFLAKKDLTLSPDDARLLARTIAGPMFHWHIYAGFSLIALLILRFIDLIVKGHKFVSPLSKEATGKQKLQGWLYILFYVALTVILITGPLLISGKFPELREVFDTVHIACGSFVGLFVVLHFGGLWLGEITDDKGIVSKMINGDK